MAEFQEVMRQRNRLCKQYKHCLSGCILADMLEDSGTANCMQFAKAYPSEFESAVMTWAKNNPEKTMKDVLLEKFPGALLNEDGSPDFCARRLGFPKPAPYDKGSGICYASGKECAACWNRPSPEE